MKEQFDNYVLKSLSGINQYFYLKWIPSRGFQGVVLVGTRNDSLHIRHNMVGKCCLKLKLSYKNDTQNLVTLHGEEILIN